MNITNLADVRAAKEAATPAERNNFVETMDACITCFENCEGDTVALAGTGEAMMKTYIEQRLANRGDLTPERVRVLIDRAVNRWFGFAVRQMSHE